MTPYAMARHDCANFLPNNSCLGVMPEGLLNPKLLVQAHDKCLLGCSPMKPCRYFEQVVLPLADNPSPKDNPDLQAERLEAREIYLNARKKPIPEAKIRKCECGALLAKYKQVCEKCARKRQLESKRKYKQKTGSLVDKLCHFDRCKSLSNKG